MAGQGAIAVTGVADLQRAFGNLSRDLGKGVREALAAAADPVRADASLLAREEISGLARARTPIGQSWWQMRVGVTRQSVYVAPVQRGVKSKGRGKRRRPNLAPLLLEKAMEPALERNRDRVEHEILSQLDELFARWEGI